MSFGCLLIRLSDLPWTMTWGCLVILEIAGYTRTFPDHPPSTSTPRGNQISSLFYKCYHDPHLRSYKSDDGRETKRLILTFGDVIPSFDCDLHRHTQDICNGPGPEPSKTCLVMTPSVYPFAASKHGARRYKDSQSCSSFFFINFFFTYSRYREMSKSIIRGSCVGSGADTTGLASYLPVPALEVEAILQRVG